jgi:short-subunit dehydrogenase
MVGAYCATKAAVVSLSESWYGEYKASNIGVSVLCPSFVKSRIHASPRNRQEQFGGPIDIETLEQRPAYIKSKALVEGGIDTAIVGERVVEAIINNELYVFTHPHYRQVIDDRYKHLSKAFDKADASPALESVEREEIAKF